MRNATFDALDRVPTVQKQSGQDYTFQYDPVSRTTTLPFGSGVVRTYGLDPLSHLTTQIDNAGSSLISTFVDIYDPVGNRIGRVQDGATNFVWTYDNDYRLLGWQNSLRNGELPSDKICRHESGIVGIKLTDETTKVVRRKAWFC